MRIRGLPYRCGRGGLGGGTTSTSDAERRMCSAPSNRRRGGISPSRPPPASRPTSPISSWRSPPARKSREFADFLLEIAASYPQADTIHLVLDNLSTHTRKAVVDRYGEKDGDWLWRRFTVHHTPKHGSWLNQAEIEIGISSRQCLGKRRIGNIDDLTTETHAWNQRMNQDQTTIDWKFTRKKSRRKLKYTITRS